jgi:shikimate dehydrogenase
VIRLALLGDPVAHSLSPAMQNAALKELGVPGEYTAIQVAPNRFEFVVEELRKQGFIGANVTIPHKERAFRIANWQDEASAQLQVANTLKFGEDIKCINTDAPGFMAALGACAPGTALVLGAGGAARAAVWALSREGWTVRVWSRSPEKANSICMRDSVSIVESPNVIGCDLIVNATPIGLRPGEVPSANWKRLKRGAIVFDMAYRDGPTDLLQLAESSGARIIDGREMLVEQGALSLEWWLEMPVPREPMRMAIGLN